MDSPSSSPSLSSSSFNFRENCFDFIRLYAALSIVLGHSCRWLQPDCGAIARHFVGVFPGLILLFCMSGYLVAGSYEHAGQWRLYLRRRFVRLYPGLWMAFLVSAVAVAILCALYNIHVPLKDWCSWIVSQLSVFQFYTPASLKAYGIGNPNGVLWTIPIEICMYFLIMWTYKPLSRLPVWAWLVFLAFLVSLNVLCDRVETILPLLAFKLLFVSIIPYMYMFYGGMFIYIHRDWLIPLLRRAFPLLLTLYLAWFLGNRYGLHWDVPGLYLDWITGVLLVPLCFSTAYRFGKHSIPHDYSYSIYLYHEIFVNVLIVTGFLTASWWGVAVVYAATLLCSFLSCHFVEEPVSRWLKK